MIEEKLEIAIPTYNRGKYLDKTLEALLNSPIKNCKITIRDNASTDNTPEICKKYSKLFKNLNIIRNNKNIGGNANILRSYEQATYQYIWVLADNDIINFDYCDDLIESIESDKYDLIICSSGSYAYHDDKNPNLKNEGISKLIKKCRNNDENYLENNAQDLLKMIKQYYFVITSFIPSTIYKTNLIDSETLIKGYDYISISYPHYSLILKALDENLLIYKTKKDIVLQQENPDDWEIGKSEFFYRRIDCANKTNNKEIQKYVSHLHNGGLLYTTFSHIIVSKALDEPDLKINVFNLIGTVYKLKGWIKGFFYQIFITLCYLIPRPICKYAYNKRFG